MTTAKRRIIPSALAPDVAWELEREQATDQERTLVAELAAEETFAQACTTFREALDAYVATFPQGLDHFDPDMELDRALHFSMEIRRATMRGIDERLKAARVRVKRASERRFA